jgi:Na+/H+ antiporter NhaD/arsenite permease-like protein
VAFKHSPLLLLLLLLLLSDSCSHALSNVAEVSLLHPAIAAVLAYRTYPSFKPSALANNDSCKAS